jgi:hypothetical protein
LKQKFKKKGRKALEGCEKGFFLNLIFEKKRVGKKRKEGYYHCLSSREINYGSCSREK